MNVSGPHDMEPCSWWWLPSWPWLYAADVMVRCVGAAFVVHRWLAPWSLWTLRRAACWTRWALSRGDAAAKGTEDGRRQPSTCACCGGVDFDGMVGRWAVVTGCTDGIGKEYALQLAERGINVALISRTLSKLQAVAKEIDERYGVQTRIVVADFTSQRGTTSLTSTYDGVRRGLDGLDVALLVNNAGMCYKHPDRLLDLPPCCSSEASAEGDPIRDVIECNTLGPVAMCRIVMPMMLTSGGGAFDLKPDRRDDGGPEERNGPNDDGGWGKNDTRPLTVGGVVVNVASISTMIPCPMLTVYAATKAFLYKFSTELAAEYNDQRLGESATRRWRRWPRRRSPPRIDVRCLNAGVVATKMSRMRPAKGGLTLIPGPSMYASHSIRALACHCGCRLLRNDRRARTCGKTGPAVGGDRRPAAEAAGWLTNVASAVFDSPSSPFRANRSTIATTGFIMHTLVVHLTNVAVFLLGEDFVSKYTIQMLSISRDRIVRREEERKSKNTEAKEHRRNPEVPKFTDPSTTN